MMKRFVFTLFLVISLAGSSYAFQRDDSRDQKKPPPAEKPREKEGGRDNKKPPEKVIEKDKDKKRPY